MFAKPDIKSAVSVTIDWNDYVKISVGHVRLKRQFNTFAGTVIASEKHDDPATFRLLTNNAKFPVSVVPLKQVCELIYDDGSQAVTVVQAVLEDEETWDVVGSKGAEYTVTCIVGRWSCTWLGFSFRQSCKHIIAKKQEVLDR